MRPLIGLNTTILDIDDPLKAKASCHLKYIDAVASSGGIPILIPPYTDEAMLDAALTPLDGFCLIGGPDYLPEHYGGHKQPESDLMPARRHNFDLWLAERLLNRSKKPVLGICGGCQLINITLGGALIQDLPTEWKPDAGKACTLTHADSQRKGSTQEGDAYRHEIKTASGSLIARIAGSNKVMTNSYHHQAVDPNKIASGIVATAWSPDGVIEAIESKSPDRFLLGVQWHPERQTDEAQHKAIFRALVEASTSKFQ